MLGSESEKSMVGIETRTILTRDRVILFAFLYLQVLDLMTTLVGFRLGLGELSPFIRLMITVSPGGGVLASKAIAILLAGVCVYIRKPHIVRWITVWYAGLVIWNLSLLLRVAVNL